VFTGKCAWCAEWFTGCINKHIIFACKEHPKDVPKPTWWREGEEKVFPASCCNARDKSPWRGTPVIDHNGKIKIKIKWDNITDEEAQTICNKHHSLTKENTMNCELKPGQKSVASILEDLNVSMIRRRDSVTFAEPTDEQKEKADLAARKKLSALVLDMKVDTDEICLDDKFGDYYKAELRKMRPKVDMRPFDAMRKEIEALKTQITILGDEAMRAKALDLSERVAKL
jgi:hypothetical protein